MEDNVVNLMTLLTPQVSQAYLLFGHLVRAPFTHTTVTQCQRTKTSMLSRTPSLETSNHVFSILYRRIIEFTATEWCSNSKWGNQAFWDRKTAKIVEFSRKSGAESEEKDESGGIIMVLPDIQLWRGIPMWIYFIQHLSSEKKYFILCRAWRHWGAFETN